MKTKLTLASAFIVASSISTAEIVVNDFLSFEGFVDMSYSHYDGKIKASTKSRPAPNAPYVPGPSATVNESGNSYQVDQVEISWLFDFDPVTAQIDLQYEDIANSSDFAEGEDGNVVEQAFVTYHLDNGVAVTAGRYASMLGFEAFEPTGLYQYSTAYGLPPTLVDIVGQIPGSLGSFAQVLVSESYVIGPRYNQGVKLTYESESSFFGVSLQDGYGSVSSDRLGGDDGGGYAIEMAGAYYMDNGLSFFGGLAYGDTDGDEFAGTTFDGDGEAYLFNFYTTYETGAWLFAAELFYGRATLDNVSNLSDADLEATSFGGLIMANYAYSDNASVTARISYSDNDAEADVLAIDADADAEVLKFTLAHSYALTDNLLLVAEVSYTEIDAEAALSDGVGTGVANAELEELFGAIELIFSF